MTDQEEQILRQEATIGNLRAENAQLKRQVSDLNRMNETAQRFIGRLQKQLKTEPIDKAEAVFRK